MSIRHWSRSSRVRRAVAAALVVLSAGGLVLAKTPAGAIASEARAEGRVELGSAVNASSFSGQGLRGQLALSHSAVLSGGERRVYAELDLVADAAKNGAARAPLAMVLCLDTSGSMAGDKLREAKKSAIRVIREMHDDDRVAFVRYASDAEVVLPLSRVGDARAGLIARVEALEATGGTNIPLALHRAVDALATVGQGPVRRVVLMSDGLDGTRAEAEAIARESAHHGATISTIGIGLDFDQRYMGGVAQAGRGNFAFVEDASALAGFLRKEVEEGGSTTVQSVTAKLRLPRGVRFVGAMGGDVRDLGDGRVEVSAGSLFVGDERRVTLELAVSLAEGERASIEADATWTPVSGDPATAHLAALSLGGTNDAALVEARRDPAVFARSTSVVASARELEANDAYQAGDSARAQALIEKNVADLDSAARAAPAAAAPLRQQAAAYRAQKKSFAEAPSDSSAGQAAAKHAATRDFDNMNRNVGF